MSEHHSNNNDSDQTTMSICKNTSYPNHLIFFLVHAFVERLEINLRINRSKR